MRPVPWFWANEKRNLQFSTTLIVIKKLNTIHEGTVEKCQHNWLTILQNARKIYNRLARKILTKQVLILLFFVNSESLFNWVMFGRKKLHCILLLYKLDFEMHLEIWPVFVSCYLARMRRRYSDMLDEVPIACFCQSSKLTGASPGHFAPTEHFLNFAP